MSELYTEQRPWGEFTVLLDAPDCKVKRITVKAGQRLSLQRHCYRREDWVCVSGQGLVTHGQDKQDLLDDLIVPGDHIKIHIGMMHRVVAGPTGLVFIETQTGSYFGEDDIERFEDDFGRV
tara:strand:- start:403 stop:765 length:363 start_codon:yes stop_codon:yes gene_type:complete